MPVFLIKLKNTTVRLLKFVVNTFRLQTLFFHTGDDRPSSHMSPVLASRVLIVPGVLVKVNHLGAVFPVVKLGLGGCVQSWSDHVHWEAAEPGFVARGVDPSVHSVGADPSL